MAEKEGFEPSMEFCPHTPLAGERLQPLGHLSGKAAFYGWPAKCQQNGWDISFFNRTHLLLSVSNLTTHPKKRYNIFLISPAHWFSMHIKKRFLLSLTPCLAGSCFAATPIPMHLIPLTPFKANILNNPGQALYLAQGSPNDPNKLNNPLLCPVFASDDNQQLLNWELLNGVSFPATNPSPDIEVALYLAPKGSASTPSDQQSDPCQTNLTKTTPITCTNPAGYIKDGTIKFSTYGTQPLVQSPVVTITHYNAAQHTATCTMNTYSYITAPLLIAR